VQVLIEKALDRLDPEERTALEQRLAAVEVLEKELGDRRYRLETLIRHLPEPVVLTDLRGIIVAANEHALSLLGRTVAEAIERGGVEFSDLISSEDLSFERSLPELIRTSRHLQAEYTLRRGDGTCFTAELNLESVKGLDDRPEFLVRVLRDVTEKTWVREKLHQLETSYEAIAQLSNSAILLADESGRLLSWNKGAEAVFRYLAEEILGHPIQELISPRYFEVHAERFARLFAHGSTVESEKDLEVEGLRKGGEEFPMELSIVAWRSGDERYFSAILRDITNYKQTQVKLIELTELLTMEKAALNEKNIALKEILGQIEHDRKEFTLQLSSAVRRTVLPVIDRLEVEFEPGLNVLTGETGAGKTILVEAIDLLVGGRASADLVRTGEDLATVQAIFERPGGPDAILRREISAQGRSRAFIDDTLATTAALREFGSRHIDLHGQHEHQALLDPAEMEQWRASITCFQDRRPDCY